MPTFGLLLSLVLSASPDASATTGQAHSSLESTSTEEMSRDERADLINPFTLPRVGPAPSSPPDLRDPFDPQNLRRLLERSDHPKSSTKGEARGCYLEDPFERPPPPPANEAPEHPDPGPTSSTDRDAFPGLIDPFAPSAQSASAQ